MTLANMDPWASVLCKTLKRYHQQSSYTIYTLSSRGRPFHRVCLQLCIEDMPPQTLHSPSEGVPTVITYDMQ